MNALLPMESATTSLRFGTICRIVSVAVIVAVTSQIISDVGYTPATPVEQGIRRFVDWYLEYYKDGSPANPKVVNLG